MKKHNFNAGPSILPREVIENTAQAIGLSPARTRAILKEMSGLEYEGTTNNRRYRLADDN